jgi:DNA-binding NtrC family response regulator
LVVDDDQQMVRVLKRTLERDGYFVIATTSGKKALAAVEERLPALLILLNMPGPNGLDILGVARSRFPYLRTLVISGYLKGEQLDAAGFLGAVATLEKPFAPEALVTKVREVLGG